MEISKALSVPYTKMVLTLFKEQPTLADRLVHVAMGLTGEVLELEEASSRQNLLEELGDLEFYLEAGYNQIGMPPAIDQRDAPPLSECMKLLKSSANEFQDLAKKAWVYEKAVNTLDFAMALNAVRYALNNLHHYYGFSVSEVRDANKIKLIGPKGRFKDMQYTNDAAIARADKAPERNFIGSTSN